MALLAPTSILRVGASLLSFVVLLSVANGALAAPRPAVGPASDSAAQAVSFSVGLAPTSAVSVSLAFTATASLSGGTIQPGQSVAASASLVLPPSINLTITYSGITTGVPVAAVGNSVEVPVPGLSLSYLGVPLGVFLNFSSEVTAVSNVSGPGTGGGGPLNWTSSGSKSFSISANASAAPGSVVTSTLGDLQYSVALGIDAGATIPLLGAYVVHLVQFGHLGLVTGSPSSVQSTYVVPSPAGSGTLALDGTSGLLLVGGLVALVAGGVLVVLFLRGRRRSP